MAHRTEPSKPCTGRARDDTAHASPPPPYHYLPHTTAQDIARSCKACNPYRTVPGRGRPSRRKNPRLGHRGVRVLRRHASRKKHRSLRSPDCSNPVPAGGPPAGDTDGPDRVGPAPPCSAMYKYTGTGSVRAWSRSISGARIRRRGANPGPSSRTCLPHPPLHPPPPLPPPAPLLISEQQKKKNKGKKSPPPCCCRLFGLDRGPPATIQKAAAGCSAHSVPLSSPQPAGSCCSTAACRCFPPFSSRLLQISDPGGGGGRQAGSQPGRRRPGKVMGGTSRLLVLMARSCS